MALVSSKKCKLCGNENGHFFCYDCKHVLCHECRLKHDRIPALKNHTITASDVIDRSAYTSKSECTIHDQECSLYCSMCKTLTCTQCVTSSHKNHSFVDISAVASEARKSAEDYIAKIKEKISNLSDMITKVKSCHMKKLGEEAEQVLFKIDCSSQDLQKIIDSQTDISKINVEDWQNLEKADVEVHLQGLEQMYKVHTKLCDELENMLREKHDKSFFLYFKNLKADCENLEEIPEEIDFKHIEEFDTNAFVHNVTAMIVKKFAISNYGRTDELQDQIKDQKLELLALHDRTEHKIKTVEAENTLLKRQLQRSHARIESLEKEMSDSKQNIEHSAKIMKAVTEENKMLKHKLETSETRIKTVEEKNAIVQEKLERFDLPESRNTRSGFQSLRMQLASASSVTPDALNSPVRPVHPVAKSVPARPLSPAAKSGSARSMIPDAVSGSAIPKNRAFFRGSAIPKNRAFFRCFECSPSAVKQILKEKERVFSYCEACRKNTEHAEFKGCSIMYNVKFEGTGRPSYINN